MKYREQRPSSDSSPKTTSRRDHAVAPGKRTLTMGLASRHAAGAAPLQRRPATTMAQASPPRSQAAEGPVEDWMAVALRPDLHQEPIMRKSMDEVGYAGAPAPSASGNSGATAMPAAVQAKMEHALGADLSRVRIHQGPEAQALGALAYTQGTNVHFAPGQYDPSSQRGQELLGHELAHVVQQSQGRVQPTTQAGGAAVNDDATLEREADGMAAKAARGEPVSRTGSASLVNGGSFPVQMMRASDVKAGKWYQVQGYDEPLWLVSFQPGKYDFARTADGQAEISITNAKLFSPAKSEPASRKRKERADSSALDEEQPDEREQGMPDEPEKKKLKTETSSQPGLTPSSSSSQNEEEKRVGTAEEVKSLLQGLADKLTELFDEEQEQMAIAINEDSTKENACWNFALYGNTDEGTDPRDLFESKAQEKNSPYKNQDHVMVPKNRSKQNLQETWHRDVATSAIERAGWQLEDGSPLKIIYQWEVNTAMYLHWELQYETADTFVRIAKFPGKPVHAKQTGSDLDADKTLREIEIGVDPESIPELSLARLRQLVANGQNQRISELYA